MKTKLIVAFILGASFMLLVGWTTQMQKPARQTWEYKTKCNAKGFDDLGAEGWELVTATSSGEIAVECFYFKRAK